MGEEKDRPPKCLVRFGGKTLLQRHLDILQYCGIHEVVIGVGYRADLIQAEIAALGAHHVAHAVFNPDYEQESILTLWTLRNHLSWGGEVLLMDADVLYDYRLIERLLASGHQNCFLLDRNIEPGDEPTKLCVRDGYLVDFHKKIRTTYDYYGESVGFFRLSSHIASRLADATKAYIEDGKTGELYDEPLRDLLLASPPGTFGFEDITGLPWIEIDFPEDVLRGEKEILPRLVEMSR